MNANADIGDIVSGNLTVLHICAENGLIQSVRSIILSPNGSKCVSIKTTDGNNLPIHLAAMAGHQEIVRILLDSSKPYLDDPELNSVEALMEDGVKRMKDWEARNGNDKL